MATLVFVSAGFLNPAAQDTPEQQSGYYSHFLLPTIFQNESKSKMFSLLNIIFSISIQLHRIRLLHN